jgi:hypothetical protein
MRRCTQTGHFLARMLAKLLVDKGSALYEKGLCSASFGRGDVAQYRSWLAGRWTRPGAEICTFTRVFEEPANCGTSRVYANWGFSCGERFRIRMLSKLQVNKGIALYAERSFMFCYIWHWARPWRRNLRFCGGFVAAEGERFWVRFNRER